MKKHVHVSLGQYIKQILGYSSRVDFEHICFVFLNKLRVLVIICTCKLIIFLVFSGKPSSSNTHRGGGEHSSEKVACNKMVENYIFGLSFERIIQKIWEQGPSTAVWFLVFGIAIGIGNQTKWRQVCVYTLKKIMNL